MAREENAGSQVGLREKHDFLVREQLSREVGVDLAVRSVLAPAALEEPVAVEGKPIDIARKRVVIVGVSIRVIDPGGNIREGGLGPGDVLLEPGQHALAALRIHEPGIVAIRLVHHGDRRDVGGVRLDSLHPLAEGGGVDVGTRGIAVFPERPIQDHFQAAGLGGLHSRLVVD
jgi:hypothetical protein